MNASQIVLGVFVDLVAAPFCYEGCAALLNKQWLRAIIAYIVGIPLALVGLSIVGIISASYTSWVIPIVQPLALDARWWLLVLVFVLLWIGGPRLVERIRAVWQAAPNVQSHSLPKKEISPETKEALSAAASMALGRPVGIEESDLPQPQTDEFALTRLVFVSRIEVDFTDLINLDRLTLAFTVHAFTGALNPIVIDNHLEGFIRWREQTEKGAEDRGYLSALAPQINAAVSELGPISRCTPFQFRLEQAVPYSIALQIWQALHAKKTLHFEFTALNVKAKIQAPVTREERFPLWAGVYCRKSNDNDIYVDRVIAMSGEIRTTAAFRSGPTSSANRVVTTEQRRLFGDEVKRLSLQGRSVQIKGSAHDAETRDYWHALVELFRANGMSADGQLEDFPSYDPSGLILVVQEGQVDHLTGHAKTIFELLHSAQIPFALGHDGKMRKPDDWCYLFVGRRS
jgi:hypothetical protein